MPSDGTHEFAPLLSPGRHTMSLTSLQTLCLDPFDRPSTRDAIFAALELMIGDLSQWGVNCEIWIDGDFLTGDPNPEMVNLGIIIDEDVFESLDIALKNDILTNLNQRHYHERIDAFVAEAKCRGHPDRGFIQTFLDDFAAYWQVTPSGWVKGLAVIRLGETDVGLWLLP